MEIIDSWIKTDEKTNKSTLYTQYEDKRIKSEPVTPKEAAQWMTQKGF